MNNRISLNRKWKLFVVNHSHIDIGYTDCQERIAAYHAQFIKQALEAVQRDQRTPHESPSRFKFTVEGFWALEQFWNTADSAGKDRLVAAIRDEAIELSPFYLHLTELLDQGHLAESLMPAKRFAETYDVRIDCAMGSDINGFSWGFSDALYDAGVRYLMMNINTHHGGNPFNKPLVPFYWVTPTGEKLLVWNGLPYHKANLLGLMTGLNPDSDPGIPGLIIEGRGGFVDVQDTSLAESKLFSMLKGLEESGYPYDFLPLMGSGLYTDNSPVSDGYCRIIEAWNQKFGHEVMIQSASLKDFFIHLEHHADKIPSCAGDWTDWWSDGAISTPRETAIFRHAQRTKRLVEKLDPAAEVIPVQQREEIARKLVLYAEHTWGHSHSYSEPWDLLVHQTLLRKTKLALDADEMAGKALYEVMQARGEGDFTASRPLHYKVINPLQSARTDVVRLPADGWETSLLESGVQIVDEAGAVYPYQISPSKRGKTLTFTASFASGEERSFRLQFGSRGEQRGGDQPSGIRSGADYENAYYRIEWNESRGVASLVDKESRTELLSASEPPLGSPVYQVFPGGKRSDAAGYMFQARTKPADEIYHGNLVSVETVESGPVFDVVRFVYESEGALDFIIDFTFYRELPTIELRVRLTKTLVRDAEGMYVSFPFHVQDGIWLLDKPGGPIRPGIDQLPGTCKDYYMVQGGASLAGPRLGITWSSLDAPMVHIGGLRLWNYTQELEPVGTLYSWLTNNKWETNFKSTCEGHYEFRYRIDFGSRHANGSGSAQTYEERQFPLVVLRY